MGNATKTVSADYLMGIKEGRAIFNAWQDEGYADFPALASAHLDNLTRTIRLFDAQSPVGQMLRGESDFWRNQMKKSAA